MTRSPRRGGPVTRQPDRRRHDDHSDVTLSAEDEAWLAERRQFPIQTQDHPAPMIPLLRRAWEQGDFCIQKTVEPHVHITTPHIWKGPFENGLLGSRINMGGAIQRDDMQQQARLETSIRVHVFETVRFYRQYVPGFEQAYLLFIAPYLGARGGPFIAGEHTLTPHDAMVGTKLDDVLYRNTRNAPPQYEGAPSGFDVPYRILLPKGVDGLLVTGNGASYLRRGHDSFGMRGRPSTMMLGAATGTAAALAVREGVSPRQLDVKKLQRELLRQGVYLGDEARLAELGLR